MKITFIGTDYNFSAGGPLTNRVKVLIQTLAALGTEVRVITFSGQKLSNDFKPDPRSNKIELIEISANFYEAGKAINKIIQKIALDTKNGGRQLLWVETSSLSYSLLIAFLVSRYKISAILEEVEDLDGQIWQQMQYLSKFYRPGFVINLITKIVKKIFYNLYFWESFKYVIAITPDLQKKIAQRIKREVFYLPIIWIDSNDEFTSPVKNFDFEYIAYCGSSDKNKDGIDLLLEGFSIFAKKHPNIKLVIMGNSNKYANEVIFSSINRLNLQKNVIPLGYVSDNELKNNLKNAIALVLTKRNNPLNKFNFPTKIIDYLEAKKPLILPDLGIICKYFKDGYNAFLFKEGNATSLAETMERIYNQEEVNKIIGNSAKLLTEDFDAITLVNQLLQEIQIREYKNDQ